MSSPNVSSAASGLSQCIPERLPNRANTDSRFKTKSRQPSFTFWDLSSTKNQTPKGLVQNHFIPMGQVIPCVPNSNQVGNPFLLSSHSRFGAGDLVKAEVSLPVLHYTHLLLIPLFSAQCVCWPHSCFFFYLVVCAFKTNSCRYG
ncbi:UNVERIFIED_CONTAM: hypothetical protein K2H54_050804 [Gekko kuhli]